MTNEESWAVQALTWFIGFGAAAIGYLMNRSINRLDMDLSKHGDRLDDHDKQHTHCTLELSQFKTEVATNYAKDITVQQSLARIHDRIDDVASDIKTILGKVK